MKKLKRILLMNWLYFGKQLIEVDDVNFLTGKNGAGKSTVIDALQIVLLGETSPRNFNKAANDSSQRTLEGYLRADMDDSSPKSRRGKDFSSYIACEFHDDQADADFVAGIVFDCRHDGTVRQQYFLYDGVIPDHCFVENRQTMSIPALRAWLKSMPDSRGQLFDTNWRYREELLSKWNVHTDQVCRMLKKAVSFRPIVDIRQFITENICDIPEKPDIEAMQQTIRDYQHHERLAEQQEKKLEALDGIGRQYQRWLEASEELRQVRFLSLWAEREQQDQQLEQLRQEEASCRRDLEESAQRCRELEASIADREQRKSTLQAQREKSDIYREQHRLQAEQRRLQQERRRLSRDIDAALEEIQKEAAQLTDLCRRMNQWPDLEAVSALRQQAEEVERACAPLLENAASLLTGSLEPLEQAQAACAEFSHRLQQAAYSLSASARQSQTTRRETEQTLALLQKNVKDYPAGLLQLKQQMTDGLQGSHPGATVEILADVLEIADGEEAWRGAVEGFLNTQKFYLLVEPEVYDDALALYDGIKGNGRQTYGLVDVGQIRQREQTDAQEGSLARKVETDNDLARSYINYLLGRVICCETVSELREHRAAITADGMVYQGYVARPIPRQRMEDAFLGRKAVALRMEKLRAELRRQEEAVERLRPVEQLLEDQRKREVLFTARFCQEMAQRQADAARRDELDGQLQQIDAQLEGLDLLWLEDLDREMAQLDGEIVQLRKTLREEDRNGGLLTNRLQQLTEEKLPQTRQLLAETERTIEGRYPAEDREAVGLPRYREALQRLKKPAAILRQLRDQAPETEAHAAQQWEQLLRLRREYVQQYRPCPFAVDAAHNDEFEAERQLLADSALPQYREKIRKARESALEQFQNDFLAKLKSSIDQVQEQVRNLNRALERAQFGTDRYRFLVERNPDYGDYYDMILSPELMEGEGGLFALPFQQKYGPLIEDLFSRIAGSDDTEHNARQQSELQQNIERYTDFRTYLRFDLETTDGNGNRQLLSKTLNTKSGGETQTPFYIAVLASFAQLYRVNDPSGLGNTVRLVIFDEAFNKMDSERIVESIRLLRKMHLQAIICTPPDKLPDIMPEADRTLLVCKDKYRMQILPYSKERAE